MLALCEVAVSFPRRATVGRFPLAKLPDLKALKEARKCVGFASKADATPK